jgi:hypothetical protein
VITPMSRVTARLNSRALLGTKEPKRAREFSIPFPSPPKFMRRHRRHLRELWLCAVLTGLSACSGSGNSPTPQQLAPQARADSAESDNGIGSGTGSGLDM